jgi:hypothetical protein
MQREARESPGLQQVQAGVARACLQLYLRAGAAGVKRAMK